MQTIENIGAGLIHIIYTLIMVFYRLLIIYPLVVILFIAEQVREFFCVIIIQGIVSRSQLIRGSVIDPINHSSFAYEKRQDLQMAFEKREATIARAHALYEKAASA